MIEVQLLNTRKLKVLYIYFAFLIQYDPSKKLTAKDIPTPEPLKMELVKEDLFGSIYEGKIGRSFWIQAIFFLLVFEIGLAVGLTIGGNAL